MGPFRRALEEKNRGIGTAVMGVLNVTPDSFYDGGRYHGEGVTARIDQLIADGAFVVDIGAESTRPGAESVAASLQLQRLEPAVRHAVGAARCWVSVDTSDPVVADTVLGWGAHIINDVSCLSKPELARVTSRHQAALIVMHARGTMDKMSGFSLYPEDGYADVVGDVMSEWAAAKALAVGMGMAPSDILFDPGIGFAKSARHSMAVLKRLAEYRQLDVPIVLGLSRKSLFNLIEVCPPEERLGATVAACLFAAEQGAALLRVHDVQVVRQALDTWGFLARVASRQVSQEASCSRAP